MIRVTQVLDYFQPPELVAWRMREGNKSANKEMRDTEKVGTKIDTMIKSGAEQVPKDSIEVKN